MRRSFALAVSALLLVATQVFAFSIQKIQVRGLHRISRVTVMAYLPVRVGDELSKKNTTVIIRKLYQTGFFSDVQLTRQNGTLVITVEERPTIGGLVIKGGDAIPKEQLQTMLRDAGLQKGRIFNVGILERLRHRLETEYASMGRYNAAIDMNQKTTDDKRVLIYINIDEGAPVKVKRIKILGNEHFSDRQVRKQLVFTEPGIFTLITKKHHYNPVKLEASLDRLQSFYFDRGYLDYQVVSSSASLTPDKRYVHVTIHVSEGEPYTLIGYRVSGDSIVSKRKLNRLLKMKTPTTFSRKKLVEANRAIGEVLGNLGYAKALVNASPNIDQKKKTVFVDFKVNPGRKYYVRRISFSGNRKTEDEVLRQSLRQIEGGLYSHEDIEESIRQLNILGYLKNVSVHTIPVLDTNNQIDLDFGVEETNAAQASLGIGYGTDGLFFDAGLKQKNFLGTGKTVSFRFRNDDFYRVFSLNYVNPFYRKNGTARSFSIYSQRATPGRVNVTTYRTDQSGLSVSYSVPLQNDKDRIDLGLGFRATELNIGSMPSTQLVRFICDGSLCGKKSRSFQQVLASLGWSYNSFDRVIFTRKGLKQSLDFTLSLPAAGNSLRYYKSVYQLRGFAPMGDFIFTGRGMVGYGDSYGSTNGLPFMENFLAGGVESIRGYKTYTLGPRDSNNQPIGGNVLFESSVGLILPIEKTIENLRTTLFFDMGNVYDNRIQTVQSSELRKSVGIAFEWKLPIFGEVMLSYAKALDKRSGDKTEELQFTLGTSF